MRSSKLRHICGLRVVDAVLNEGNIGFSFEKGISLAIYNKIELVGFTSNGKQMLIGNVVEDVDEKNNMITIRFRNSLEIRIDMRDEAYMGPEAMQLRIPGEPIVIWS
jgi:hypothetical protein